MNLLLVSAAALSGLLCVAHVFGGQPAIVNPMLGASFDPIAKRTMLFTWHYVTISLAVTAAGLGYAAVVGSPVLAAFLVAQLSAIALLHLGLASTSGIEKGMAKMFQWVLFAIIASLGIAGLLVG